MKTYFRYALVLMALLSFVGCSSDDSEEINENTATRIYKELKGTYEGSVRAGNEMYRVTIVVANDEFTVKQLPLQPILQRIFTNQGELEEALKSAGETSTFTAPILNISLMSNSTLLTMEPADMVFTVKVGVESKQVSALISAYANWVKQWGEMSVQMNVIELFCDGQNYNLTENRIEYFIDNAKKSE